MSQKQILIVSIDAHGMIQETTLESPDQLVEQYEQVGIDDCSTDLSLRGYPVVKGLVGPIPESRTAVRYETSKAFEQMTKEWEATKVKRRRRTKAVIEAEAAQAEQAAAGNPPASPPASPPAIPAPMAIFNTPTTPTELT